MKGVLGEDADSPGVGENGKSKHEHVASIVFARLHIPDTCKMSKTHAREDKGLRRLNEAAACVRRT